MTESTLDRTGVGRGDRVALLVLAGVAVALGVVLLVTGGYRTLVLATAAGETPLELLTSAEVPHTNEGQAQLVHAGFTEASVVATGLSAATRALLAVGNGLGVLTGIVVCAAIAVLFISVAGGRPFARRLYSFSLIAGVALAIGSPTAQFVMGLGQMNAALELNPTANDVFQAAFGIDPTLLFVGFAVMALAFVFRAGARLQRDTEGLV